MPRSCVTVIRELSTRLEQVFISLQARGPIYEPLCDTVDFPRLLCN